MADRRGHSRDLRTGRRATLGADGFRCGLGSAEPADPANRNRRRGCSRRFRRRSAGLPAAIGSLAERHQHVVVVTGCAPGTGVAMLCGLCGAGAGHVFAVWTVVRPALRVSGGDDDRLPRSAARGSHRSRTGEFVVVPGGVFALVAHRTSAHTGGCILLVAGAVGRLLGSVSAGRWVVRRPADVDRLDGNRLAVAQSARDSNFRIEHW